MSQHHSNQRLLGILSVVAASLLWGTEGTATIYAPHASVATLGIVGLFVGMILQVGSSFRGIADNLDRLKKQWLWVLIGGIAFCTFPFGFLNSVRLSGIAIGTVITMGSSPIFSALIERIIDKQHLTKQWMMGFPLGLLGIILLSFLGVPHNHTPSPGGDHTVLGAVLALLAGFCFSLNSWSMHRLIEHHIPARSAAGTIFLSASICSSPIFFMSWPEAIASKENLYVTLYIGIVIYFMAYMAFSFGLSRIKTSTATVITLLEPVAATLLACSVAHERLSLWGWTGIILLLICMTVMALPTPKQNK